MQAAAPGLPAFDTRC